MGIAEVRAQIEGQMVSSQTAILFPSTLKGYWADNKGDKVIETFFGDEICYYLESAPKYKLTLSVTVTLSDGLNISCTSEPLLNNVIDIQPTNDEDICVAKIKIKDRWELNSSLKETHTAVLKLHIGAVMYGISEHTNNIDISEFKVKNNFIINGHSVKQTKALDQKAFSQGVHAVVLHRTDSNTVLSALNSASNNAAAHLYVDKNGDIYHKVSFINKAPHVGRIRKRSDSRSISTSEVFMEERKKDYPERYPYNEDSIGIEVVGKSINSSYYLAPTDIEQIKSVARLVNFLMGYFSLSKDKDIYGHEIISSKSKGEGQTIHDAIKSYIL